MFKNWTDVCAGKMTLWEIAREIVHYMHYKKPSRLIIDIKRRHDGYHTKIWMSIKDFQKEAK